MKALVIINNSTDLYVGQDLVVIENDDDDDEDASSDPEEERDDVSMMFDVCVESRGSRLLRGGELLKTVKGTKE